MLAVEVILILDKAEMMTLCAHRVLKFKTDKPAKPARFKPLPMNFVYFRIVSYTLIHRLYLSSIRCFCFKPLFPSLSSIPFCSFIYSSLSHVSIPTDGFNVIVAISFLYFIRRFELLVAVVVVVFDVVVDSLVVVSSHFIRFTFVKM